MPHDAVTSDIMPTTEYDGSEKPDPTETIRTYAEDLKIQQTRLLLIDMEHGIAGIRDLQGLAGYLIEKGWRK